MVEKSLFKYNGKEEKYLWYEYVPALMKDAPNHSIPLVILLHGHNNDPRTQAETSGFPELGAQEGFMVAELEWQGKSGLYDYMGDGSAINYWLFIYDITKDSKYLDYAKQGIDYIITLN